MMGALHVEITFYCKEPKKPTKEWPRGDIDNYIKALFDSFNGVVWGDDDQVVRVTAEKVYCHTDARVEVQIRRYES